ncbi:MAG: glycosyltransferase family 9 protein [Candidatus Aminicenantales bacterium]
MIRKGKPRIDPSTIKKILLIRLRRIGDIVMTTPALSVLRENLPDAFLAYVVEQPYKELLEGHPCLDRVIVLPRRQKMWSFLRFVSGIRKQGFDAVLDFHSGPRASWMTLFSGAKVKIGYKIQFRNFVYDKAIPRDRKNGHYHSVENHLNIVKAIGIPVRNIPSLSLPPAKQEETEKIRKFIAENGLVGFKMVVLHISAGNEFRRWGAEKITELLKRFSLHPDIKVVLVGTEEDRDEGALILRENPEQVFSLIGKLNLRELRELILSSSLFIGPDSGPMHIAASTPTPIVVYFGPTLPAHFAPWKARAFLIEKKFECRPCKQRKCVHKDFRCLQSITPEEVYEACLRFL